MDQVPAFLLVDWLLSNFGKAKGKAVKAYCQFASKGKRSVVALGGFEKPNVFWVRKVCGYDVS